METINNFLTTLTPLKVYAYIMLLLAVVLWYISFRLVYRSAFGRHNAHLYMAMCIASFTARLLRNLLFLAALVFLAIEFFNEMVSV